MNLTQVLYGTNPNPDRSPASELATTTLQSSVTQYGITWTFDQDYSVGQFLNGDYFVVDEGSGIDITNITPVTTQDGTRWKNGTEVNPVSGQGDQGFDGYKDYDSSKNAAQTTIAVGSSLSVSSGDKVVSAVSVDEVEKPEYLQTAAVLTVISSVPPEDAFRPGYCDSTDVATYHRYSDLNTDLLKTVTIPGSPTPTAAEYSGEFARLWLDHLSGSAGTWVHPLDNLPEYGRDVANMVGSGGLRLNGDESLADKRDLLIGYIQAGIDQYTIVNNGRNTHSPDGGIHQGRKLLVLFAALLLDDSDMQTLLGRTGDYIDSGAYSAGNEPPDYVYFQEDCDTFYIAQADVDITNSGDWNPDSRDVDRGTAYPYVSGDIGFAEWGIRHSTRPETSNRDWIAYYRYQNGQPLSGLLMTALLIGGKTLWNHDCIFDYCERYMAVMDGDTYTPPGEDSAWTVQDEEENSTWRATSIGGGMYDTYWTTHA